MSAFTDAVARLESGYYNSGLKSVANPGGLANYGHVTNFPALCADVGIVAEQLGLAAGQILGVADAAGAAATSAEDALAAYLAAKALKETLEATLSAATVEEVWAGNAGSKIITPFIRKEALKFVAIHASEISGGSITPSGLRGLNRSHLITATTLIAEPANLLEGETYTLELQHLGAGAANFGVTFNEKFLWGEHGQPSMPTGVNKRMIVRYQKLASGWLDAHWKRFP